MCFSMLKSEQENKKEKRELIILRVVKLWLQLCFVNGSAYWNGNDMTGPLTS